MLDSLMSRNGAMARIQPVLSDDEAALVERMAELTGTRKTEVVRNALAAYRWLVGETLGGARVVSRRASGEEVSLETPDLAVVGGKGRRLAPRELGILAKRLASAKTEQEAAELRERLTRGFYGI